MAGSGSGAGSAERVRVTRCSLTASKPVTDASHLPRGWEAREDVLGSEEGPENVQIKCSTKGNNGAAILMLSLELGGARGPRHRNHESVHRGDCGHWPASPGAAPGRTPGDQASLCLTCLPLVSRQDFESFKQQNTETESPKQTQQAFSEETTLFFTGRA